MQGHSQKRQKKKNSASWNYGILSLVLLEAGVRTGLNMKAFLLREMAVRENGKEPKVTARASNHNTSLTPNRRREGRKLGGHIIDY